MTFRLSIRLEQILFRILILVYETNLYRVTRREILTAVLMASQVLWDVTPRLLRNISGSIRGAQCLLLLGLIALT